MPLINKKFIIRKNQVIFNLVFLISISLSVEEFEVGIAKCFYTVGEEQIPNYQAVKIFGYLASPL